MSHNKYKVGQLVKVLIPDTYGTIDEILEKPIEFHRRRKVHRIFKEGGVTIQFMEPLLYVSTMKATKYYPNGSIYPFKHTKSGEPLFELVNPEEEIAKLQHQLEVGVSQNQREHLEKALVYIKKYNQQG